jgi:hypothetical protein
MTFRIESALEGPIRVLLLSGRIRSENLDDLKDALAAGGPAVLDLDEVTLIDADAVCLLESLEACGVALRNCAPYLRSLIGNERAQANRDGSGG